MARRTGSIFVTQQSTPWAGGTGANLTALASASGGALTVSAGLPTTFDVDRYIESGIFNQLFNLLWDMGIDIGQHGILEWHTDQSYLEHARVIGSDGMMYRAVQDNSGEDPTTDSSDTYWILDAGATASNTEVEAGTDSGKAVTPSGLLSLFDGSVNARWRGTESEFGLTRLASSAEVDAATSSDRVVTPAGLRRNLLAPLASPALTGNPTAPTQTAGNSSTRIATTEFVGTAVSGAGASYVHLTTAPSFNNTSSWAFGTLESGASTYVRRDNSNFNLSPVTNAPRGFIGYVVEIYQGSTFHGRVTIPVLSAGANVAVYIRTDETTVRRIRVRITNPTTLDRDEISNALDIAWQAGQATGYEARVYAIKI